MQPSRPFTIRPRQRSRTSSLSGFDHNLVPQDYEWGVDRLQIFVLGDWHTSSPGQDHWQQALSHPDLPWFTSPTGRRGVLEITNRERASITLGSFRIGVTQPLQHRGTLRVDVNCNPTRTLAHILARASRRPEIADDLASLDVASFFARAPDNDMRRSLDGRTNWLSDIDQARHIFGRDVFGAFLPVFLQQLQRLIALLLAPTSFPISNYEGATEVIDWGDGAVRVRWGEARVPQIESYFERFHGRAKEAVLTVGRSALTSYHDGRLARHHDLSEMQREGDAFTLTIPFARHRKLKVYAKSDDRIRFEIVRDGRGRYGGAGRDAGPLSRLLAVVELEKREAIASGRWPALGEMFREAERPLPGDFVDLLVEITRACAGTEDAIRPTMIGLLIDGGLFPAGASAVPIEVIDRLARRQIIQALPLRAREQTKDKRYVLAEHYRAIREVLLEALERLD